MVKAKTGEIAGRRAAGIEIESEKLFCSYHDLTLFIGGDPTLSGG
jgi:hypothetical protein